jgi:hypothetical protein
VQPAGSAAGDDWPADEPRVTVRRCYSVVVFEFERTHTTTSYLWNNQLRGSIPESLGNLTQLRTLCVQYAFACLLCDSLYVSLNSYLATNQLTGIIPSSLGNLTNLQYLCVTVFPMSA